MTDPVIIRDGLASDRHEIVEFLLESWGSSLIVSRGRQHDASLLEAKVAVRAGRLLGLATFHFADDGCELVTLDAVERRVGVGTDLLNAVIREARRRGARRIWLITSNDNLDALRFYQRRGMRLIAVHSSAVDEARRIKPSIPRVGDFDIEIHDEFELEMCLDGRSISERPHRTAR